MCSEHPLIRAGQLRDPPRFQQQPVFGNVCNAGAAPTCVTGGVFIGGLLDNTSMPHTSVLNNAFALNDGNDVELQTGSQVDVLFNNINVLSGTPESSAGNLNIIDPQFVSVLDDDSPEALSLCACGLTVYCGLRRTRDRLAGNARQENSTTWRPEFASYSRMGRVRSGEGIDPAG